MAPGSRLRQALGSCFGGAPPEQSSTSDAALPPMEQPCKLSATATKGEQSSALRVDDAPANAKNIRLDLAYTSVYSDPSTSSLNAPSCLRSANGLSNEGLLTLSCPQLSFPLDRGAAHKELPAKDEPGHEAWRCKTSHGSLLPSEAALMDILRSHRVSPTVGDRMPPSARSSGPRTYMFGPRLAVSRSLHLIMHSSSKRVRSAQVQPVKATSHATPAHHRSP